MKMHYHEFFLHAWLCGIFLCDLVVAQYSEVISRNPVVTKDGKMTVNLDDLLIEITAPKGRENVLSKDLLYQQWKDVDDVEYWESIYGSMDNIPAFEDLPEIPGKSVEFKFVRETDNDDFDKEERDQIFMKNLPKLTMQKYSDRDIEKNIPAAEFIDANEGTGLFKDRCEWKNPLYPIEKLSGRERRDIKDSKGRKSVSDVSSSDQKRKGRTVSLLQGGLGSRLRSDYLLNKYGRKHHYGNLLKLNGRSDSIDECIDDEVIGSSKSNIFASSAINIARNDQLVNLKSGLANTGQVVAETIVNAARQLSQAKQNVIDLGVRATEAVGLESLNNASTDCLEETVDVTSPKIDSGLEVVGNSVLDTNSGIVNADSDLSIGITASLGIEAKANLETATEANVNTDSNVEDNINASLDENAETGDMEIPEVHIDNDDSEESKHVIEPCDDTNVGEPEAVPENDNELNLNTETEIEVNSNSEKPGDEETVQSMLNTNTDIEIGTSLDTGKTITTPETDINVERNNDFDNARRKFEKTDFYCQCGLFPEDIVTDRGYYSNTARRYCGGNCDDIQDELRSRQGFPDEDRYRINSKDYEGKVNSGIHADAGIHTSLDTGLNLNTNHGGGIQAGTKASVDLEANVNIGRSDSKSRGQNYRTYGYDRRPSRYRHEFQRDEEVCDCQDSEEYREFRRRLPDDIPYGSGFRGHHRTQHSGIQANTGIHTSLDADANINSNIGSVKSGAKASINVDSTVDVGTAINTGIHTDSGIHSSLNTGIDVNSERNAGGIHVGTKSSLDVDSHVDFGRSGFRAQKGNRQMYDDFDHFENDYDYDDSGEYPEYRRRFPDGDRSYRPGIRDFYRSQNYGIQANAGIHSSLDTALDVNTNRRAGVSGINSGLSTNSGIHASLDAGIDLKSNINNGNLRSGSRGSLDARSQLDIGHSSSRNQDEIWRTYDDYRRDQDISYECDDEREKRRRFSGNRYRNRYRDGQGINSGIHAVGGIQTSLDSNLDINSGHSRSGIKSSLDLDSYLDVGTQTNTRISDLDRSSAFEVDSTRDNDKIGEKLCDAACRRVSNSREFTTCPNFRFDNIFDERSEYLSRGLEEANQRLTEGPPFMCENCRRRFYAERENSCPDCGKSERVFEERLPFLSSGTMYHFDRLKQNCKRKADQPENAEPYPENACGYNHCINLDANCTDEAFKQSPDCQNMDYNLQTPRDGNPVPLGFVRSHLSHGHDLAMDMHDRAKSLVAGGLHPRPHTASMLQFFQSKVPDDLVELNEESELTLFGTKLLQNKLSTDYNITPNSFLEFLNHHGFRVTGNGICHVRQKRCGGCSRFRSIDGSCNNVAHPTWGQSNRAFARILPARYSDGIHGIPVSVTGAELPNPRRLSARFYSRLSKIDPELTLAVVQWGQTLAHDLARQVTDQTTKGGIECCADNGQRLLAKSLQHHSCAPISISPKDKFYSNHGQRCMNFVRAMTVPREDCTLGPADQLNGATSFLDCSPMYGVDKSTSDELREFTGGRMKVEFRSGRWMMPTTTNQSNFCDIWSSDDVCYRSGDPRNNQNPQLVILQTLLVREHNRLADGLSTLNPEWDDERIFQESRRIVIAEYQHITYNDWLPLVLGKKYAKKHGLFRAGPGMSNEYNDSVNPTTIIGFTSGAFRSLHSMIEGDLDLCNIEGDVIDSLRMSDHYFRPRVIERNNNFEHLLRGLATQRMQMQDFSLHSELTEYLFRSKNNYGMDLAAIDIQRGRDHGIPGYNAYRKICRLRFAENFNDLCDEISWENIDKLQRDYAHVDDVDLIVGATMENRAAGSHFGPTIRCLIGEQFYRSRVGDKYFYDNENFPHSFTPEQFTEIKKVTLSRLMCDMGGAVAMIQRDAFRAISPKNPLISCKDLPKLDLKFWTA